MKQEINSQLRRFRSPVKLFTTPLLLNRLNEMEVKNLPFEDGKKIDVVNKGGVVILPTFGAAVDEMMVLNDKNVQIVDTTYPWVSKVWNTAEKNKGEYTSGTHGKYSHEETIATASFAGKYIIEKNMAEIFKMYETCQEVFANCEHDVVPASKKSVAQKPRSRNRWSDELGNKDTGGSSGSQASPKGVGDDWEEIEKQ